MKKARQGANGLRKMQIYANRNLRRWIMLSKPKILAGKLASPSMRFETTLNVRRLCAGVCKYRQVIYRIYYLIIDVFILFNCFHTL